MQEETEYLWSHYDVVGDCWIWNGYIRKNKRYAYDQRGTFRSSRLKKTVWAHRLSYEITKGEIPKGMLIRHTCDNPLCINPDHLILGTPKDNHDDMVARGRAYYQTRTHCKYGHPWSEENTSYIYNPTLKYTLRRCKACHNRDRKKYRIRQRLREKNNPV